jgi:hypothetical protein
MRARSTRGEQVGSRYIARHTSSAGVMSFWHASMVLFSLVSFNLGASSSRNLPRIHKNK